MKKFLCIVGAELKRAICSWRAAMLMAIGLMLLYQPVFYLMNFAENGYMGMDLMNAMISATSLGYYTSALPLLSRLMYSDSFAWEYVGGAFPYMIQRAGRTRYICSKLIAASISAGLLVSGCFAVFCIVQAVFLAPGMPSGEEVSVAVRETLHLVRYGITWSLVGLGISAIVPNPILSMAAPFCVAQFLWLISAVFDIGVLDVKGTVFTMNGGALPPEQVLMQTLMIAGAAVAMFVIGVWKRSYGK